MSLKITYLKYQVGVEIFQGGGHYQTKIGIWAPFHFFFISIQIPWKFRFTLTSIL